MDRANPAAHAATQATTGPADGLPQPARNRAMLVIILGITMAVLDGSIVNLALPGIARELNASAAQAIWVVNAYQIATLVMLLPLASLGERLGYRRVYLVGMALFTVSSVGAMLADSLGTLIFARAVQGLGAAGIMSINAALVRLTYPRAQLGRGLAINSMVVALAAVAGPSVAAGILSLAPWQWLFALNLPLGAFTLWLGWRALPFNPPSAVDAPWRGPCRRRLRDCKARMWASCSSTRRSRGPANMRTAHAGAQRPLTCTQANTSVSRPDVGVKCRSNQMRLPSA